MSSLKAIHIVHMKGCPHCVIALREFNRTARELGVPCLLYDVYADDGGARAADELVRRYGDWSEDYIVPQIFFETSDGSMVHALTGYPEGVQFTERAIHNLLGSEFLRQLAQVEGAGLIGSRCENGSSADTTAVAPDSVCSTEGFCTTRPHSDDSLRSRDQSR